MWEKISDYCLDVSKYLITAAFITTFVGDIGEELHWLIYLISFILAVGLFWVALYFDKKGKKEKEERAQTVIGIAEETTEELPEDDEDLDKDVTNIATTTE